MSEATVWQAVTAQARAWEEIPLIKSFAGELPYNRRRSQTEVSTRLSELEAGGADITGSPLRAHSNVLLFSQIPMLGGQAGAPTQQWRDWMSAAERVERAHRDTVAWLRSRLPGYPRLPALHLAANTALTTDEFSRRLSWPAQDRAAGYQFMTAPQQTAPLLQATGAQAAALNRTAQDLATALQGTESWQQLAQALGSLDHESRSKLIAARTTVKRRLDPRTLDAHDTRVMERHDYRCAVLQEEIDKLDGAARTYSEAFDAVDRLIEFAASDVFGQLAIHGKPQRVSAVDLDVTPGSRPQVHFTLASDHGSPFHAGLLVQTDDPLIPETCHSTAVTWSFSASNMSTRITAEIIPGTVGMWR